MKIIFIPILFVAFAIVNTKADMNTITFAIDACLKQFHVSKTELNNYYANKNIEFSDTLKCHTKCVLETENLFKNGKLDVEQFVKNALMAPAQKNHEAEINKIVKDCANQEGVNDCDTAFKVGRCLYGHHNLFLH
ncbi:general odorant-binding protein 56h-like [Musca autumnalis]|uniref:general odorant-binding protein 56h-like n=1 Tax=Musca autumnalis TaxID=221902 RepID=UPI003CF0F6DA